MQPRTLLKPLLLLLLLTSLSLGYFPSVFASDAAYNPWRIMSGDALQQREPGLRKWIQPEVSQAAVLDGDWLQSILDQVPNDLDPLTRQPSVLLSLPAPDGSFETFALIENGVMAPELAAWMAEQGWPMKTYTGESLDEPGTQLRLDWGGPGGLHARVSGPGRNYQIDPAWQGDREQYVSYYKRDYLDDEPPFSCAVHDQGPSYRSATRAGTSPGAQLRIYRLAMAATGEYTTFHGGTKVGAQAAIVTTVNRVNQIFERDLSLQLQLIANNSDIIYTDANSDPYTSDLLTDNQNNLDNVIGSGNYDIGHIVTTGNGGVAQLASTCDSLHKAEGMTGRDQPVGDPFDVDYVAHEMGHQLGGNHTFNSNAGACEGNREDTAAYEPGSGSTIMGYAGICSPDDLQANSDDYFHGRSLDEMLNHLGSGGNCFTAQANSNANAPTVEAGSNYTIPVSTPFELIGSNGQDGDGDSLTYTWEEFDLGATQTITQSDNGASPILRSWSPSTSSTRVIPRLEDLLAGTLATGERLPTTDRTMNFRLTVRDNNSAGGRIGEDSMTVTSTTSAGPFALTAPNGGQSYSAGQAVTVTWNVASTSSAPVNASQVDILLSTDGGNSFPHTLAGSTTNDGSESVTLPGSLSATTNARIKIKAVGNIFFDLSDANFSISGGSGGTQEFSECRTPAQALTADGTTTDTLTLSSSSQISDLNLMLNISHTFVGDLSVTLEHQDGSTTSVAVIERPGEPASQYGCDKPDINATLDDEASDPVENQCAASGTAISGTFTPNNALDAFDGQSLNGTWRLKVSDAFAEDTGTLNSWCLSGTGSGSSSTQTLTLTKTGSGGGTVTSSASGIDCGSDCTEAYATDTQVTLTATPDSGSVFAGWSGACSGTGSCSLTMSSAQSVTATFNTSGGDTSCASGAVTLPSPGYSSGTTSVSSQTSIASSTSGSVAVTNGASLTLRAPNITLYNGFSVASGSALDAKAQAVTCP